MDDMFEKGLNKECKISSTENYTGLIEMEKKTGGK
jgi:hypothetical protein